jgi:hypothetical protein
MDKNPSKSKLRTRDKLDAYEASDDFGMGKLPQQSIQTLD